jgi:hypothetical protein
MAWGRITHIQDSDVPIQISHVSLANFPPRGKVLATNTNVLAV